MLLILMLFCYVHRNCAFQKAIVNFVSFFKTDGSWQGPTSNTHNKLRYGVSDEIYKLSGEMAKPAKAIFMGKFVIDQARGRALRPSYIYAISYL